MKTYAEDLAAGRWKLTHQGIAFDVAGQLIDGQHRLSAIVEADCAALMLVFRNVGEGSKNAPVDVGLARTMSDLTGLSNLQVASLRNLERLCTNTAGNPVVTVGKIGEARMEAMLRDVDKVLETVPACQNRIGPVVAALAFALPVNPKEVLRFADQVTTGANIDKDSPAFALRAWLDKSRKSNAGRVGSWYMALAVLNAVRYHLCQRDLRAIFTGESGYHAFVSRRRAIGIGNTPTVDEVPGVSFVIKDS